MEREIMNQKMQNVDLLDGVEIGNVRNKLAQISQFQNVVKNTLKEGHDYGVIGGVTKPALLKPGAEKILMLMGLTSEYDIIEKIADYDKGIFAYTIKCTLRKSGMKITEGVGSCNSKEDKYRWRWVREDDLPMEVDRDTLKSKSDSYGHIKYRIENDDIFSQANTILKMAKKRAQVDATLTVASLSEIFTQDVEDMAQFQEKENIENMKPGEVGNIAVRFGKHKGQTLGQILDADRRYIEWLAKNGRDASMRKACAMLLNSKSKPAEDKPADSPKGKEPPEDPYEGTPFADNVDQEF